jgi:hypothetical protein
LVTFAPLPLRTPIPEGEASRIQLVMVLGVQRTRSMVFEYLYMVFYLVIQIVKAGIGGLIERLCAKIAGEFWEDQSELI